jgi:hypothetical protein
MPPPPSSIGTYYPAEHAPQTPARVAVVIPTVLRLELIRAIESVYEQDLAGTVQIMVGVDIEKYPGDFLDSLLARRPAHVSALVLKLPYSTSARHGGMHYAQDGGSTRTTLSFMANSQYVAYLDDDNTWMAHHLSSLLEAIEGKSWAYSHRILVDEDTGAALGQDLWHSVGPVGGTIGGFVDPSCLMVDKVRLARTLGRWSENARMKPGNAADRHFFESIRNTPYGAVEAPTVRYSIRSTNAMRALLAQHDKATRASSPAAAV